MSDVSYALFDVPQEAFVYLSPTLRWERDPTLSEFMSHSQDLLLGALLHATLTIMALKQCIQTPCHLDAEPDFVVDFCLPSPVASSQPLRLPDGRW